MEKLFFTLLLAGTALAYSCHSGDNTVSKSKVNTETSRTVEEEKNAGQVEMKREEATVTARGTDDQAVAKATAEICECINGSLKDISPKVQQIFIRAGNSERPLQVLQNEIVTISDNEQEELFVQLQRFSSDPQLQSCSEEIRKKYGLDPNDPTSQEKILRVAKNNKDCALVYALIKIGMQQQLGGSGN